MLNDISWNKVKIWGACIDIQLLFRKACSKYLRKIQWGVKIKWPILTPPPPSGEFSINLLTCKITYANPLLLWHCFQRFRAFSEVPPLTNTSHITPAVISSIWVYIFNKVSARRISQANKSVVYVCVCKLRLGLKAQYALSLFCITLEGSAFVVNWAHIWVFSCSLLTGATRKRKFVIFCGAKISNNWIFNLWHVLKSKIFLKFQSKHDSLTLLRIFIRICEAQNKISDPKKINKKSQ